MSEQMQIRVTIMRGGTSRAVFVRAEDLPPLNGEERDALIRAIFGSPDRRQIDGIGGADLLTSKFAIIGSSSRPDADLDYTFAQVGIEVPEVAWDLNCGNISAAVGPYALEEGIVPASDPSTTVRIHNTNTGKLIVAEVPVANGRPVVEGDFAVDGVPGTGARVKLDFSDGSGARTGALLPTGHVVDELQVDGVGRVEASIVDAANPIVFVAAERLGLTASEDPLAIEGDASLMESLEAIRRAGAAAAGINLERASTTPFVALVGSSRDWSDFATDAPRAASSCDLVARLYVMSRIHKAYAGTGTICTGVAVRIKGTVANRMLAPDIRDLREGVIRLGHPSGVIEVDVAVEGEGAGTSLRRAAISRTARRLLDGQVYVRRSLLRSGASDEAVARA